MRRKALLLTTSPQNAEMEELVFALGADLVASTYQRRSQPDPQFFLGSGKLEEARGTQRATGADLVVVNAALRPGQIFNIQRYFNEGRASKPAASQPREVEVYDRTRLILEIFRERARSPEARLQVELATLQYEMPLVKEAINLEKKGERQAAMFGGGAYGVDEYYNMMKKRMARIRRDLEKMRLERGVRRKHRRRGGFHLVSLAGYTNAGKSSLLRALSEKETLVENRYFSTLSTKTARAHSDRREILVTDTVGFIEDLPPWMVEAFHSTLEEIAMADVILLVLDASDEPDEMSRRLRSSLRILAQFEGESSSRIADPARAMLSGAAGDASAGRAGVTRAGPDAAAVPMRRGFAPIVVALNKVDRLSKEDALLRRARLVEDGLVCEDMTILVSARTRAGLDELYERLISLIPDYDDWEIAVPASPEGESFIAWLHDVADVLDLTRGNEVHVHFEAKRSLRAPLASRMAAVGATKLREAQRGLVVDANANADADAEDPGRVAAGDANALPAAAAPRDEDAAGRGDEG